MALTSPGNPLSPPPFTATLKPASATFKRPAQPLVPSFAVNFSVKLNVNNEPLADDIALWIVAATVDDSLNKPSEFTLELISKEDERTTKAWTDDPRLALGAQVILRMGYGTDLARLIVGDITSLEPAFSVGGPPTLVVRGYDRRNRLNGVRQFRPFPGLTDAAIAQRVCHGLVDVLAADNGVRHDQVVQNNQTDLEFLLERAEAIGYELVMDDNDGTTLLFRRIASGAPAIAKLTLNDDLLEFHPRLSLQPVSQLHLLGWDPKTKEPITVSAASDSAPPMEGNVLGVAKAAETLFGKAVETVVRAVASVAEANTIAAGTFNKAALSHVTGAGTARGRPDIRAGTVINIAGLGDAFSGNYYVESARHRYSPKAGYLTDFDVKRNAS